MIPALKFDSDEPAVTRNADGSGQETLDSGAMPIARTWYSIVKRIVPWLVGAAILAYILWHIEYQALMNALSRADAVLYGAALFVFIIMNFIADTQNLHAILKHANHEISFKDTRILRGASYLLMTVDYTLGMVSIAYYLNKFKNIPFWRGMGLINLLNYTTQVSLALMAIGGVFIAAGSTSSEWLDRILVICVALLAFCMLTVLFLRYFPDFKFVKMIKENNLFKIFNETPATIYPVIISYRFIYYFTFILFYYVAVRAFNIEIPFTALIAYVPVIMLVISIPISAFGLGTSQAAMLILFKDYGTPAQILAFSLAYSASIITVRGIIGAYYYSIITRRVSNKYKASMLRGEV